MVFKLFIVVSMFIAYQYFFYHIPHIPYIFVLFANFLVVFYNFT